MVEKIKFINTTDKTIEILIEPEAEYISLLPGKTILIVLKKITDDYEDELTFELEMDMLIIYESRQCDMQIFIDDELKYFTTPGRVRI